METGEFVIKALARARASLEECTKDLAPEELKWQAGPEANHISFLIWHLTRGEDRFIHTTLQGKPQVLESGGWGEKAGIPTDPNVTGFGYTAEQVKSFPAVDLKLLLAYHDATRAATLAYVSPFKPADFDRIVEHPRLGKFSIGELLARIICEVNQHTGQIAYLRGLKRSLK